MSEPVIPPKAKLFIGLLFNTEELLSAAERILFKKFGEIDFRSGYIPFANTDYYDEIGPGLKKIFLSFKRLIRRDDIVSIKLFTNRTEKRISGKGARRINIDPGYLTLSNVYLATCKEFFHRVYLGRGVYLENEYRFTARNYQPWEWTYPDYRKHEYINFFHETRKLYQKQIRP